MIRKSVVFGLSLGVLLGSACSVPSYEPLNPVANSLAKSAAIDSVYKILDKGNCAGAYTQISALYDSTNSDNEIRLAMAAVYGCYSKINIFKILSDMVNSSVNFGGSGFWEFLVREFPSTSIPDDRIPQASQSGIDVIMATLSPGVILLPAYTINSTSHNPGSILVEDRIQDANAYITFLSMALMGSLMSRNGLPSQDNRKTQDLPWGTADSTQGDGCLFASATVNFLDGLQYISSASPPNVAAKYAAITGLLSSGLDTACSAGCTICAGSVSCTSCPRSLRDRNSCLGNNTDINSCAAAGITIFVNATWAGP